MKLTCDVIQDLIPLVKDGVASDDTIVIVNEHIKNCDECKSELNVLEFKSEDTASVKDEMIITSIKRSIYMTQLTILIVGTGIGLALTNTMGMFYNFIIMPFIGGISFLTFKRKWYLTPMVIFILNYLWQTIMHLLSDGFNWYNLLIGIYFSIYYTVLVISGVVIAMLLKFALKKGD